MNLTVLTDYRCEGSKVQEQKSSIVQKFKSSIMDKDNNQSSKVQSFEDLDIYQQARQLCKDVYEVTKADPWKWDSRFVQQIHAAAGSVMDNIAEGYERQGNKEFINFLYIAKGSCGEVRSQIIRAVDVEYLPKDKGSEMYNACKKLSGSIVNFMKGLRQQDYKGTRYNTEG